MTNLSSAPLAARVVRRLRRAARSVLLKAADVCEPHADLGGLANVQARVFTPPALGAPLQGLRYLLLGLCQVGHMADPAAPLDCRIDHMLYDGAAGRELPAFDPADYDAVLVALTLRAVLNEAYGEAADLLHARDGFDAGRGAEVLERAVASLRAQMERLHTRVPTTPTFFFSFLEPSFSYLGQLQPACDLSSPLELVRGLNAALVELAAGYPNVHVFDLNGAFNMIGRLHLQDDGVTSFSHACIIGTFDDRMDRERLVPFVSNHHVYDVMTALPVLQSYVFRSLGAAVKTLRGDERVKLIIVDLDDTLWRGVAAESQREGWERVEGWPLGLAEALLYFKRRGGLLAICSKNEREPTLERFAAIWRDGLRIEDFASVKIDWRSKADNIAAILEEVNILPAQALFIDDNPREIDEVRAALPELRCLGGSHRDWRRIILRAPETQVEAISEESARRTELVRARVDRDLAPAPLDRAAWLQSLQMAQHLWLIDGPAGDRFERALELLNKTNQFNTTGQRWSRAEIAAFFKGGGRMLASTLKDRTVDNGLVSVALVRPGEVVQVVLSCRVFGLGAETTVGALATALALQGGARVRAGWMDTGRNLTCRGYYDSLGYTGGDGRYKAHAAPPAPPWIAVSLDRGLQAELARPALVEA